MKKIALLRGVAAVLAVALGTAIAAPASAAAIVTRQTITIPTFQDGLTDGCHPGLTGTLTGTANIEFQVVETSTGFHVKGTEVDSGRIDWVDGSYTIIGSADHVIFEVVPGTFVHTTAHVDFGNNYSADGTFLFTVTFHQIEHVTITNGVVTRVDFVMNHVQGGQCNL
jgi:ABC-type transport system substrate-binding protein